MKVNIVFDFKEGPYGGGNQFLKAVREEWRKKGVYTDQSREADVFLFNSFQNARRVVALKRKYPQKIFIHRVDGPIALYRASDNTFPDQLIFWLNRKIARGTIFQSRFSQKENQQLGLRASEPSTVIINAAQEDIFFPAADRGGANCDQLKQAGRSERKIRLISTSWSDNWMKGFKTYQYLDEHLDFSQYEYTFVGRSPVKFKNIKLLPPRTSRELAKLIRSQDIYITASKKDPCSNSLIEALSSGLPAVALNDGGHPEIVGRGGEFFRDPAEIENKLEQITKNYSRYVGNIPVFDIEKTAAQYLDFIKKAIREGKRSRKIKRISRWDELYIKLKLSFNSL